METTPISTYAEIRLFTCELSLFSQPEQYTKLPDICHYFSGTLCASSLTGSGQRPRNKTKLTVFSKHHQPDFGYLNLYKKDFS